ncbi:MAG: murein L,D-transpeptidase catalytic domain family protein [Verrucomicrobiota bacterium]
MKFLLRAAFFLLLAVGLLAGYYVIADRPSAKALEAARKALEIQGINPASVKHLAVVDFDKPSYLHRMVIYKQGSGPKKYLVAHGSKTGGLMARDFSNTVGSHQSSLGLYRVGQHYLGRHGKSCRLHGLEKGRNDKAFERDIVLHPAWYVDYKVIKDNILEGEGPRIGRSQGCPAVSHQVAEEVLAVLTEGSYLYIHADQPSSD